MSEHLKELKETRLSKSFGLFFIMFWIAYAIYFSIEFPKMWNDPDYSRLALLLLGIIPSILLVIIGVITPFITKVVVFEDFVYKRSFISSKILYSDIKKVEIGPNFIKLHESKRKNITISWIYDNYDEVIEIIFDSLKAYPAIERVYVKKYRK